MTTPDCPFCHHNWDNLELAETTRGGSIAVVRPLDPVTEGHVLIIHANHADSAAAAPGQASGLMEFAARYVKRHNLEANIITSIGEAATQSVLHTHLHVVPRRPGDGLALPWTGQQKKARKRKPPTPQDEAVVAEAAEQTRWAPSQAQGLTETLTADRAPTPVEQELQKLQDAKHHDAERDAARSLRVSVNNG